MLRSLILSLTIFLIAGTLPKIAFAGGSDGGTNVNTDTGELVEFEGAGKRVRIDPRTFEGIYPELKSKIDSIETKIPGMGRELEAVMDLSWFVTDKTFPPRKTGEDTPILQTNTHVFLTGEKIAGMSHDKLKRAFFHEMVRRLVNDNHFVQTTLKPVVQNGTTVMMPHMENVPKEKIEDMVEALTVVLYFEEDRPSKDLARMVNEVVGNSSRSLDQQGYISRAELVEKAAHYELKSKFDTFCKNLPFTAVNGTKKSLPEGDEALRKLKSLDNLPASLKSELLQKLNSYSKEYPKWSIGQRTSKEVYFSAGDDYKEPINSTLSSGSSVSGSAAFGYFTSVSRLDSFQQNISEAIDGYRNVDDDARTDLSGRPYSKGPLNDRERIELVFQACYWIQRSDIDLMSGDPRDPVQPESAVTSMEEALKMLRGLSGPSTSDETGIADSRSKGGKSSVGGSAVSRSPLAAGSAR